VLADARELMKRMNTLLSDDNQAQIGRALTNIETATSRMTSVANLLEPAAKSSEALVADARKTFQQADKLIAELSSTNRDLAKRLEAIERAAGSAEKAGGSVAALVDSVAAETVPRINSLADELARTSRSLDRLATSLKEQPQSLVFGRKPGTPGPGETGFESRGKAKP
jgi:phospholipid/cholesterol/gamma-HCH transport system substrate-binding protein